MSQQVLPLIGPKPPPPSLVRWSVLLLISLTMLGNYYIYDSISLVADLLRDDLGFTDSQIGWLNSIYSAASIVVLLIAGILIDRFGTRVTTFTFTAICLLGAVVTALQGSFEVMLVGRLIFGLGAEAMIVAVTTALAKWFRGKELGLALGLNLVVARAGSFAATRSPQWAASWYDDWQSPLILAALIGLIAIVGALAYWALELSSEGSYQLGQAGEVDRISWGEIGKFGRSYWYIVALCAVFYSAIFPFQTFSIKFLMDAQGFDRSTAGAYMSYLPLLSMICTPLFGYLSDLIGKRSYMMMIGSLALTPVYLMFAYTGMTTLAIGLMGFALALIPSVMWPAVAYVVKQNRLGTAYALMTMIQQIGVLSFNLLIGWANDYSGADAANPGGYALGMWFFSILGFAGLFFAYQLFRTEQGPGGHGLDTIKAGQDDQAPSTAEPASSQSES